MPGLAYANNNVLVGGTLNTTAVTANQIILTYTVPPNKTFYFQYLEINVMLTTFAQTATAFGVAKLFQNGLPLSVFTVVAGPGVLNTPLYVQMSDSVPFQSGDVLTVVCTPSAVTPFTWEANLAGYNA